MDAFLPTLRRKPNLNPYGVDDSDMPQDEILSANPGGAAFAPTAPVLSGGPNVPSTTALNANPQPNLTRDIYSPRLAEVGDQLTSAYSAPHAGMARQIFGAMLAKKNPQLAGIVSGETQRQRQIEPLQQEYGLLSDIISKNRAQQTTDITNRLHNAQADYFEQRPDLMAQPKQTPDEQALQGRMKKINPATNQPYTADEAQVSLKQDAQDTKPDKAPPNAVEGVRKQLLDAMQKGDKKGIATYGHQLDALSDPTGDKATMRELARQALQQKIAEKSAKDSTLSPHAQQVLMETEPTLQQVDQLISKLEPMKNDNTSRLTIARGKYAMGIASPEGSLADDISKIELDRVLAGARVLKGSSKAYQALELAMKHAPNSWIDTPQLMYSKLVNIRQNLADVENDAKNLGKSKLSSTQAEQNTSANKPPQSKKQNDPLGIR